MGDGAGDRNGDFLRITNRDIWNKLNEIEDALQDITREKLPTRVRTLELKFYGILAGLVGGVVTVLYIIQKG